ncbi:MAG: hypothetical protein DRN49_00340 [Thaumarchaeota archaeon]|nr:MAG: hypothetical protein DRN49_00340 [Nitrososphaerota archaeon]
MVDLKTEIGVGVSNYISPFCYSVLRIEPFWNCQHLCIYCYARWYRSERVGSKDFLLRGLNKLFRRLSNVDLKILPFRISTLTDPLQPLEVEEKLTLRVLKLCRRYRIPIILNTKSTLFLKDPWRSIILDLGSKKLCVIQVSISSLRDEFSKILEPGSPRTSERLDAIREISDHIPVILRLQPVIPGLVEAEIDLLEEAASGLGVKQITVEFLRESLDGLEKIYRLISVNHEKEIWETYSLEGEGLLRPSLQYRVKVLKIIKDAVRNIPLSTCKEGLFHLEDVHDCCGFRFLSDERTAYRLTLRELWRNEWNLDETLRKARSDERIIFGERLQLYPNPIRKILKAHENRLLRVFQDKMLLSRICPCFTTSPSED